MGEEEVDRLFRAAFSCHRAPGSAGDAAGVIHMCLNRVNGPRMEDRRGVRVACESRMSLV